jgi:hypothetical protein
LEELVRPLQPGEQFLVKDISGSSISNVVSEMYPYIGTLLTVSRLLDNNFPHGESHQYIYKVEENCWKWADYHMDIEMTNHIIAPYLQAHILLSKPAMPNI